MAHRTYSPLLLTSGNHAVAHEIFPTWRATKLISLPVLCALMKRHPCYTTWQEHLMVRHFCHQLLSNISSTMRWCCHQPLSQFFFMTWLHCPPRSNELKSDNDWSWLYNIHAQRQSIQGYHIGYSLYSKLRLSIAMRGMLVRFHNFWLFLSAKKVSPFLMTVIWGVSLS